MLKKKVYEIKSNISDKNVIRSFSELKWMHSILKEEFSHMTLPTFPERSKEELNRYFKELLSIRPVKKNKSLMFFITCDNKMLFMDFKIKRGYKKENINFDGLKTKLNGLNKLSLTEKELTELTRQADKLPDNAKLDFIDFPQLTNKVRNLTNSSSSIFKKLDKVFDSVNKLFDEINTHFKTISDLFNSLSLNANDMSSDYLGVKESLIESNSLEKMFSKFKLLFTNGGYLTRQFLPRVLFLYKEVNLL